jgi:hypothetical protein
MCLRHCACVCRRQLQRNPARAHHAPSEVSGRAGAFAPHCRSVAHRAHYAPAGQRRFARRRCRRVRKRVIDGARRGSGAREHWYHIEQKPSLPLPCLSSVSVMYLKPGQHPLAQPAPTTSHTRTRNASLAWGGRRRPCMLRGVHALERTAGVEPMWRSATRGGADYVLKWYESALLVISDSSR